MNSPRTSPSRRTRRRTSATATPHRQPSSRRRQPPAERRRRSLATALIVITPLAAAFSFVGCRRETRTFDPPAAAIVRTDNVRLTELQPGPHRPATAGKNEYEHNAYAQSEGKRLYESFNCSGCHAHGGGGMGPPLLDEKWRYGSAPEQVYSTIMQGRPNGMPSFGGKINEQQAWQIVSYVRSMSGLTPRHTAPSRDDHMRSSPPPNSVDPVKPEPEAAPPATG